METEPSIAAVERAVQAARAAGAEISSRLNLSESQFDGFDPTGIPVRATVGAAMT